MWILETQRTLPLLKVTTVQGGAGSPFRSGGGGGEGHNSAEAIECTHQTGQPQVSLWAEGGGDGS